MTDILAAVEAAIAEDERSTCRDGHLGRRARGQRQIEARREILKLHGLAPRRPGGVRPGLVNSACASCGKPYYFAVPWPCPTVRALAYAYGIEVP